MTNLDHNSNKRARLDNPLVLHDLVIRTICEFIQCNTTMHNLMRLNTRFYGIRDIFIGRLYLGMFKTDVVCDNKPYGWNKVYKLSVSGSTNITDTDIALLGNIRHLKLYYCGWQITDVSALHHVHDLSLITLPEVCDISSLTHVHTIYIQNCQQIRDLSALSRSHTVSLYHCHGFSDVSMLGNVYSLTIDECFNVTDVSMLGKVHSLELSKCLHITDVSALGSVHSLHIYMCNHISDVSALSTVVNSLYIKSCAGVSDCSTLGDIPHLKITRCGCSYIAKNWLFPPGLREWWKYD